MILHIDMDAFYAAIEQHDAPELKGQPVVIGADPKEGRGRGVVSTASYEARKFGIRSAMPISEAYRRCSSAVFLPPRMKRYSEVSSIIMKIFEKYSPYVEPLSLDEAFIDCSNTERLLGDVETIAANIKKDVLAATGLTCSIGCSAVKSVAKVASDLNKPDGITVCPPGKERDFLAPLPVTCLWGVGKKTRELLVDHGMITIGDISRQSLEVMTGLCGKNGTHLWYLSRGMDGRDVERSRISQKSISEEITFEQDCADRALVLQHIKRMSDSLSYELHRQNFSARTVTVKVRFSSFETITRSETLPDIFHSFETIYSSARSLFRSACEKEQRIRLIGLGLSQLVSRNSDRQGDLFQNLLAEKKKAGESIYQELKDRFGTKISRGSLINSPSEKEKRPG